MLRAESELTGNRFRTTRARDLETYDEVHVALLLRKDLAGYYYAFLVASPSDPQSSASAA